MSDKDDQTHYIDIGGGKVGIMFPEVYTKFVFELYREHDDLVRGMELAKVTLKDGSALDYLNLMLGTNVNRDTPMELGYAQLLDALRMRIKTKITESTIKRTAEAFKEHEMFKDRLEGGRLFPEVPDQ